MGNEVCKHERVERRHVDGDASWKCKKCDVQFYTGRKVVKALATMTAESTAQVVEVAGAILHSFTNQIIEAEGLVEAPDDQFRRIIGDKVGVMTDTDPAKCDHTFSQGMCLKCGTSQFMGETDATT